MVTSFVLGNSNPSTYENSTPQSPHCLRPRPVTARLGKPGWVGEKAPILSALKKLGLT